MKIKVRVSASNENHSATIDLDDLGISLEEWQSMSQANVNKILQEHIDQMPDQPYWVLDEYDEED